MTTVDVPSAVIRELLELLGGRASDVGVDDLDTTVEAGVTRLQLNKALSNTGLTFPVDPGGSC
jgi:FAD/FMN-containing dehydrogenase